MNPFEQKPMPLNDSFMDWETMAPNHTLSMMWTLIQKYISL